MMVSVGTLIRKSPITIESGMTIRETAALMSNKDVSSVMVMQGDKLVGAAAGGACRNGDAGRAKKEGEHCWNTFWAHGEDPVREQQVHGPANLREDPALGKEPHRGS